MTYEADFLRITASGVLGTPTADHEIFANTWDATVTTTLPDNRADLVLIAESIAPLFDTFYSQQCTSQAELTNVRVALVGTDGKVKRDATGAFLQADSVRTARGGGLDFMPYPVSLVITEESVVPGPTGRGRVYVPVPAGGVLQDGGLDATDQAAAANRAETLWSALNATHGTATLRVVVASQGSVTQGIAPAHNTVQTLRVGRVPDTQRRRRGDLDEAYIERTVSFGA